MLIKAGVGPDSAGRVIGLMGFQVAAVLLTVLMLRWHGWLAAVVAVVLFEFSPFGLAWGAAALVDNLAVACSLGMVVGLDSWFRSGSRLGLIGGAVSAWLAFVLKGTTPPGWCVLVLVSAGTAYVMTRSLRRTTVGILTGPAIGLLLGVLWTRYADTVDEGNPLTRPMTSYTLQWNYGTLDQRLDLNTYHTLFRRIECIAGPVVLVLGVAVVGIALAPRGAERIRRAGWVATPVFPLLVFTNLYYVHDYYFIAIFPAIVAAVALGITAMAEQVRANTAVIAAVGIGVVLLLSAASPRGQLSMRQWLNRPGDNPIAKQIRDTTTAHDLIVLVGCPYPDPELLYQADRRGLIFPDAYSGWPPHSAQSEGIWSRENINDYGFLFACDTKASERGGSGSGGR